MNRKLRNTILAFSVTGVMLALGLMAAQPVLPDTDATAPAGAIVQATAPAATQGAPLMPVATRAGDAAAADALSARIDARSRRLEAELAKAESLEHAIATTAGFVAAVTAEAVLLEVLSEDVMEEARVAPAEAPAPARRRGGSVRSAIAVPYFSFARGTGRGDRS